MCQGAGKETVKKVTEENTAVKRVAHRRSAKGEGPTKRGFMPDATDPYGRSDSGEIQSGEGKADCGRNKRVASPREIQPDGVGPGCVARYKGRLSCLEP